MRLVERSRVRKFGTTVTPYFIKRVSLLFCSGIFWITNIEEGGTSIVSNGFLSSSKFFLLFLTKRLRVVQTRFYLSSLRTVFVSKRDMRFYYFRIEFLDHCYKRIGYIRFFSCISSKERNLSGEDSLLAKERLERQRNTYRLVRDIFSNEESTRGASPVISWKAGLESWRGYR